MRFQIRYSCAATALLAALLVAFLTGVGAAEDVIEFLSGAKMVGEVTSIDKQKKLVAFSTKIGKRNLEKEYPYSKIHAVTYQGKRFVLNALDAAGDGVGGSGVGGSGSPAKLRSRAEVLELIKQAGATPPDWYDSTPVEHPPSLDLSWQEPRAWTVEQSEEPGAVYLGYHQPQPASLAKRRAADSPPAGNAQRRLEATRACDAGAGGEVFYLLSGLRPGRVLVAAGRASAMVIPRAYTWPSAIGGWATRQWPATCFWTPTSRGRVRYAPA